LFFDFGPIFEDWEADFGRTFVIGNDPIKHKLKSVKFTQELTSHVSIGVIVVKIPTFPQ
jgi:hypothetical protein